MHPSFQTPLTEELGCDYPVIQTAMGWVSTSQLVTASVEAGAFGFLAAAVMTPQECEKEIQFIKSQANSKKIFLNVSQCIAGKVEQEKYETGLNLKKAGVVGSLDMTLELVIVKSMFLLNKYPFDNLKFKENFLTNFAGELS